MKVNGKKIIRTHFDMCDTQLGSKIVFLSIFVKKNKVYPWCLQVLTNTMFNSELTYTLTIENGMVCM